MSPFTDDISSMLCTESSVNTNLSAISPSAEFGQDILRAQPDPVLMHDQVLKNMLALEEHYTASTAYLRCANCEITSEMRKIVAEWMFEVNNNLSSIVSVELFSN